MCYLLLQTLYWASHILTKNTIQPHFVLFASTDFVLGLPHTQHRHNSIFVVVDCFCKMTYFIPCNHTTNVVNVAQLFFHEIYRLHNIPTSIIFNRDIRFLSQFWRSLWHSVNTSLNFSSPYHPKTNNQTEMVNHSLGNFCGVWLVIICNLGMLNCVKLNLLTTMLLITILGKVFSMLFIAWFLVAPLTCWLSLVKCVPIPSLRSSSPNFIRCTNRLMLNWQLPLKNTSYNLTRSVNLWTLLLEILSMLSWLTIILLSMNITSLLLAKLGLRRLLRRTTKMLIICNFQVTFMLFMFSMLSTSFLILVMFFFFFCIFLHDMVSDLRMNLFHSGEDYAV